MDKKLSNIYYSPNGYYKGLAAINKLATAAKVPRDIAAKWLQRQAIWQIYLPAPKKIIYGSFDIKIPNEVHQADILYLPHDKVETKGFRTKGSQRKTFKYALTVVDVASRYKGAEPLISKSSTEVASAFEKIYQKKFGNQRFLRWPKLLQVDPGKEFQGAVVKLMNKNNVVIRQGHVGIHRDQAIVERFNRTLAERLFGYQYAKEFVQDGRSREWVSRLQNVVAALNEDQMNKKQKKITPPNISDLFNEKLLDDVTVRYLYEPGELEGGVRRATDPIWSTTTHKISNTTRRTGRPVIYRLDTTAPQRGFTRERLQVIPEDTQLPPKLLR